MANLSEIKDNYNKYIVGPIALFGLGGFVFDLEREITSTQTANITDHYVEDNVAVQDHIAIAPERITLNSDVADLSFLGGTPLQSSGQRAAQRLVTLGAFLPELAVAEQQVRDLADTNVNDIDESTLGAIRDLWSLTQNLNPGASRQQQAYLYFKALFEQKILVSVQTPFSFFTNMAIESIVATQPEDTQSISSFSITLKTIRTTSFATVPFDRDQYQARTAQQRQPADQIPNSNGERVDSTGLRDLADVFFMGIP